MWTNCAVVILRVWDDRTGRRRHWSFKNMNLWISLSVKRDHQAHLYTSDAVSWSGRMYKTMIRNDDDATPDLVAC